MSWDQVRGLAAQGFEIGAHTVHHLDLGVLAGEEAKLEIKASRSALEDALDRPVTLFAYPFGGVEHLSEENRENVVAAGFRCCVSCHGGVNRGGADPYRLQRVPVGSWYENPNHLGFSLILRRA